MCETCDWLAKQEEKAWARWEAAPATVKAGGRGGVGVRVANPEKKKLYEVACRASQMADHHERVYHPALRSF